MCIGLPMQVIESGFGRALVEGMGQRREVDTLLVGEQPAGTWLLVFLDSAREVLTEGEAERIGDAVQAIDRVMGLPPGAVPEDADIDSLFADLVDREPPKPPSLLALEQARNNEPKGE